MYNFSKWRLWIWIQRKPFLYDQCLCFWYWSRDLSGVAAAAASDERSLDCISQRWLAKTLGLLAYHGSSGAGSSSLVCLCPLIHSGLDGLCKVQRVCGFISTADTMSVAGSGESVLVYLLEYIHDWHVHWKYLGWFVVTNTSIVSVSYNPGLWLTRQV